MGPCLADVPTKAAELHEAAQGVYASFAVSAGRTSLSANHSRWHASSMSVFAMLT
jgi:hypothetical protein